MTTSLQKLIVFGRFSIKQLRGELIVEQRSYLAILVNLLTVGLFALVFYFQKRNRKTGTPNSFVATVDNIEIEMFIDFNTGKIISAFPSLVNF